MPRAIGQSIENNFTRGLITEATGLNFPENAATDTQNCIFHERGEVRRRLGFDYETGYTFKSVSRREDYGFVIQEYIWENVGGQADLTFSVIQIGSTIYFWQINADGSLSSQAKTFTIDLRLYYAGEPQGTSTTVASKEKVGSFPCQFTVANGVLLIVSQVIQPLMCIYDYYSGLTTSITDGFANFHTITVSPITISVRDFEGAEPDVYSDTLRFAVTGSTQTASQIRAHTYNLYNQGWDTNNYTYLQTFKTATGLFPSNADVWWTMKNASGTFDASLRDSNSRGDTHAPNGHFIFDAFNIARTTKYGGTNNKTTYYRPTTVAFYAGRGFYAGVYDQGYHSNIYFSQIVGDKFAKLGKCYQQYDPVVEDSVGLLPNDGGVINIPDIGQIIKLIVVQQYLIIWATNGIWTLSGSGDNTGFTATDYTIRKISDISALSGNSFVIPKTGLPIWWNADGIYAISFDQQQQGIQVQSLTDQTIKTLYNNIPTICLSTAKGAYNPLLNVIQWVYRSTVPNNNRQKYEYDSILNLNLNTGAFYTWAISAIDGGPTVNGVIATRGSGTVEITGVVTDVNGNIITDVSTDQVTVTVYTSVPLTSAFRYPCTVFVRDTSSLVSNYNVTFAQESNAAFVDWKTFNASGADYESYFITGYKVHANAQRKFQANDIFVYSASEEGSSCYCQGLWDFASDDASGRYSNTQQIYIDRSFYGVQRRKIKLRGKGYSLQLKFQSSTGKPFKIIGWSALETSSKDG